MDKRTTNIAASQLGFIDFVVKPTLLEFGKICRNVVCEDGMRSFLDGRGPVLLDNLALNRQSWADLKGVFEHYRTSSPILDPQQHLDSTLDLGSMNLDPFSDYFSY